MNGFTQITTDNWPQRFQEEELQWYRDQLYLKHQDLRAADATIDSLTAERNALLQTIQILSGRLQALEAEKRMFQTAMDQGRVIIR